MWSKCLQVTELWPLFRFQLEQSKLKVELSQLVFFQHNHYIAFESSKQRPEEEEEDVQYRSVDERMRLYISLLLLLSFFLSCAFCLSSWLSDYSRPFAAYRTEAQ